MVMEKSESAKNPENTPSFREHFFEGIETPIILPSDYNLIDLQDAVRLKYKTSSGELKVSDAYMEHVENKVIVDEFRKLFPHDSVIVMLYNSAGELFLQKRGHSMNWEPLQIDVASVAAQRRAVLRGTRFERVDVRELALQKSAEETGLALDQFDIQSLRELGHHFNPQTNEYQTIFSCQLNGEIDELNAALEKMTGDKAEAWLVRNYRQTLDEYMDDRVAKYAGGEALRPINFISNPEIQAQLEAAVTGEGAGR